MSYQPEKSDAIIHLGDESTLLVHPSLPGGQIRANTSHVARKYYATEKKDSGILPPVVRYVTPDFASFILERPPMMAEITFKNSSRGGRGDKTNFTLPIPWTVYALNFRNNSLTEFHDMWMYFRNSPIDSPDGDLGCIPLSNMYGNGRTCLGDGENILRAMPNDSTTASYLNCAVNTFWSDEFNLDLTDNINISRIPNDPEFDKIMQTSEDYYSKITNLLSHWSTLSIDEMLAMKYRPASAKPTVGTIIKILDDAYSNRNKRKVLAKNQPLLKFFRELTKK